MGNEDRAVAGSHRREHALQALGVGRGKRFRLRVIQAWSAVLAKQISLGYRRIYEAERKIFG